MSLSREVKIGQRIVQVPVTLADRIVDYINPTWGQARFNTRLRMALGGGYTSADRTRRANQKGWRREVDADGAIIPDLQALREDSQHMARNNAIAGGAIKTNITKVVGTGLKAKPQIDRDILKISEEQADQWQRQALREFLLATETREIDAERELPFSLLQGLVFLKVLEDGDVLVNMPRFSRPGSPYKLKLQLIEAARVCNPEGTPNTDTLCAGVGKDSYGAATAYHVASRHPGRYLRNQDKITWTTIKAWSDRTGDPLALFLKDKTRPGQTRGVPYLAPVIEVIKQAGRYTDAEIMAAVVSGMVTVVITNELGDPALGPAPTQGNPDGSTTNQADPTGLELGYGSIIGLQPGEKIDTVDPNRPNTAFDPFMTAIMRQIGMALELPFEVLIKHFTASYSASRAALMEAWDYFRRRRHWLVTMLCQPVYEAVITEAVAAGRLQAPGFFANPLIRRAWLGALWIGDAPYHLDPLKEVNAARARMENYLTTHDEEVAAMPQGGPDWQSKVPQFRKERQVLLELQPPAPVQPAADPQPPEPDPDKPDTDLEET